MTKTDKSLPPEMKHILSTIGVRDGDFPTVERRLKERAAAQVHDYLDIACRKIMPFQDVEISADTQDVIDLLRKSN